MFVSKIFNWWIIIVIYCILKGYALDHIKQKYIKVLFKSLTEGLTKQSDIIHGIIDVYGAMECNLIILSSNYFVRTIYQYIISNTSRKH